MVVLGLIAQIQRRAKSEQQQALDGREPCAPSGAFPSQGTYRPSPIRTSILVGRPAWRPRWGALHNRHGSRELGRCGEPSLRTSGDNRGARASIAQAAPRGQGQRRGGRPPAAARPEKAAATAGASINPIPRRGTSAAFRAPGRLLIGRRQTTPSRPAA